MNWPISRIIKRFLKGENEQADAVLVVGVHKEELAFGDQVAASLPDESFKVMRIASGVSARRPRPDQFEDYMARHDRIYRQIAAMIGPDCQLLIDLHCRHKEAVDADVFCADPAMLENLMRNLQLSDVFASKAIRTIQLVTDRDVDEFDLIAQQDRLFSKPEMPEQVWRSTKPLYIGLEVYTLLHEKGTDADHQFTRQLLELIKETGLLRQSSTLAND